MFRRMVHTVFYSALVFLFFWVLQRTTDVYRIQDMDPAKPYENADFNECLYKLKETQFETWEGVLCSPEEIQSGCTPGEPVTLKNGYFPTTSHFRTGHCVVRLEPGITYGIRIENATYASGVYIDGVLLASNGTVSEYKEDFVPLTKTLTFYFTPQKETTDIVVQRANFNHARTNRFTMILGRYDTLHDYQEKEILREAIILGIFLTAGLLVLGMYLYAKDSRRFLWFALTCFCVMIHASLCNPKLIMVMFPKLNWYFGHRLENLSVVLIWFFLVLFYKECFEEAIPKWFCGVSYGTAGIAGGIFLFLPSTVYSGISSGISTAVVAMKFLLLLFIIMGIVRKKEYRTFSKGLIAVGALLLVGGDFIELLNYGKAATEAFRGAFLTAFFLNTAALGMDIEGLRNVAMLAVQRENALKEMNLQLTRMTTMQDVFLHNLCHELKTPITVIGTGCGVSAKQMEKGLQNEETVERLKAAEREAVRLGEMVNQLRNVSFAKDNCLEFEKIEVKELFERAADFCGPICQKNGNRVVVSCGEKLYISGVCNMMEQILLNVIINANRHTKNDEIVLLAEDYKETVTMKVEDHGTGMEKDDLEKVFERGYSKDNSSGLGLAICRDISTMHKGKIWMEQNDGGGVTVLIQIPKGELAHE